MEWLSGTPNHIVELEWVSALLAYRHGSVSVPCLEGLSVGGFKITFAKGHSDVFSPKASIPKEILPEITHIEPLYRIREDPAWRSNQG
jgi:hypothetical protein